MNSPDRLRFFNDREEELSPEEALDLAGKTYEGKPYNGNSIRISITPYVYGIAGHESSGEGLVASVKVDSQVGIEGLRWELERIMNLILSAKARGQ